MLKSKELVYFRIDNRLYPSNFFKMQEGIYESLISQLVQSKLDDLDQEVFFVDQKPIDKAEAKDVLSQYFSMVLKRALSFFSKEDALIKQIELVNKLILLIPKSKKNH